MADRDIQCGWYLFVIAVSIGSGAAVLYAVTRPM